MINRLLAFALLLVAAPIAGCGGGSPADPDETTPPANPSARSGAAMTFDAARGHVLLFGGAGSQLLADLWRWDGSTWMRLGDGPQARDEAVLSFDSARGRAVLFGGRAGSALLADTWEWDGAAWTRRDVPGPGQRVHAVGVYDPQAGRLRVYGGTGASDEVLTDTWEWDGNAWTRVSVTGLPEGTGPDDMIWDPMLGTTILVAFDDTAERSGSTYPTRTFAWRDGGWVDLEAAGPELSPVQRGTSTRTGAMLFDGGGAQGAASTWTWSGEAWQRASPAHQPAVRNGHAIAWDAVRGRAVLFGGFRAGQDFADTWEWDGTDWVERTP